MVFTGLRCERFDLPAFLEIRDFLVFYLFIFFMFLFNFLIFSKAPRFAGARFAGARFAARAVLRLAALLRPKNGTRNSFSTIPKKK